MTPQAAWTASEQLREVKLTLHSCTTVVAVVAAVAEMAEHMALGTPVSSLQNYPVDY